MQFILLLLCVGGAHLVPVDEFIKNFNSESCGYESCTQASPGMLNVHIVPHTHDDVGWLKTVDQYYYGSRNNIQKAGVQYILDSVVKELWESPKRKFIYVETAFFWKWWVRQPASIQQKVQVLVRQGRLQMIGGAWSMNDEAASHYQSTIDQFTWGLKKLNDTFGQCGWPHVGWQIDPFGHSREFANLLAMMGYDGLFLGRIDYQDKRARLLDKNMEMVWRGDDVLGKSSDIFTGVLYNTYSPPPGFCFDVLCSDEPIVDDPNSPMYNVETKIQKFFDICTNMSKAYRSNNILLTMGEDFHYQDAAMWFINLDKLIEYSNLKAAQEEMNISVFYSTPNCYLKAVKDANPTLPTKQDDFFPYASDPSSYWTGYFTSRPTTKYFEREGNNYLQAMKQLQVLADLDKHNEFVLNELKSAMGVMQHHDAITGTEKQHVTHDYERILTQAIDDAFLVAKQAFNKMTLRDSDRKPAFDFKRCHLNESSCDVSENSNNFVVTIYNPLGWSVIEPVRIPVVDGTYEVFGPSGTQIKTQMVPIGPTIIDIPTRESKATQEIVFLAELKPLSYINFYIKKENRSKRSLKPEYDFYSNINNNLWPSMRENGLRNPDYEKYLTTETVPNNNQKTYENIKDKTDYDKYMPTEQTSDTVKDVNHNIFKENGLNKADYEKYMTTKSQKDNVYKNIKVSDVKKEMSDEETKINHNVYKNINVDNVKERIDDKYMTSAQIPDAPVYMADVPNTYEKDINLDVLKGGPQDQEQKILDIERVFVDNDDKKPGELRQKEGKSYNYPMFNNDEMRMLSDDPQTVTNDDEEVLENQHFKITVDKASGSIKYITFPDGSKLNFTINMYYYIALCGDNHDSDHRASGAYIFRPSSNRPMLLESNYIKFIKGDIVKQLRVYLSPGGYIDVKLYDDKKYIEVEWLVGPIPILDEIGREYIVRYESTIDNEGVFYTDSNGRQMLKRQRNYRPQWNVTLLEPVAGNYYPVTNEIYIKDENDFGISVLTDRSHGGSSLKDGDIELMLHRRLLCDDAFGVGEALNETANIKGLVARGKQRLYFGKKIGNLKKQVVQMHQPPVLLFADATNINFEEWAAMRNEFSWLDKDLPKGIHLLTLEPWDSKLLVRFENYFENDNAIEINLENLFKNIKILALEEMVLSAHRPSEGYKQWTWKTEDGNEKMDPVKSPSSKHLTVKVKGKEIKTFLADYEVKKLSKESKSSSPDYLSRYEVTTVV